MDHREHAAPDIQALEGENLRLRRAVEELSLLNEMAAEIGRSAEVDDILQTLIRSARRAVAAEEGVITLTRDADDSSTHTLVRTRENSNGRAALRPENALLEWMQKNRKPFLLNEDERKKHPLTDSLNPAIRSMISVPMIVGGRVTGVLTVYNKKAGQIFTTGDARLLAIMASQSAQVVQNAQLREQREEVVRIFGQHTSPEVVEELLQRGSTIGGERRKVTVMFADVRGFSAYAEQTEPEAVVDYLNGLFDLTIPSVHVGRGMIHQLLGDGFMAVFGAPVSYGDDARNAARAAVEMLDHVEAAVRTSMLPPTRLGIGIHTGEVVAGLVGSTMHREYKLTGDTVNVAARIQELNKQFDSSLLLSEAAFRELSPAEFPATALGDVVIRGREEPLRLFRLR